MQHRTNHPCPEGAPPRPFENEVVEFNLTPHFPNEVPPSRPEKNQFHHGECGDRNAKSY